MNDYYDIKQIDFSYWSSDDIRKYSVVEVKDSKLSGENGVNDSRMGVIQNHSECVTCGGDNKTCKGHFGHIELVVPICHPKFSNDIVDFLTCFCDKETCNKLLIDNKECILLGFNKYKKMAKFQKIVNYIKEHNKICNNCFSNQPKYKCIEGRFFKYAKTGDNKLQNQPQITTLEIQSIFTKITDEDLKMIGISTNIHPSKLILNAFPVLPKSVRPYVETGNMVSDDDLTTKYIEIVKFNNKLQSKSLKETERNELINKLEFHISTLVDNSSGKSRPINGRPYKCLSERLNGKGGRFRTNLTGKRCDFTARSVICADPNIRADETVIPACIAERLTFPETAFNNNLIYLQNLLDNGKVNFVIRKEKDEKVIKEKRYDIKLHSKQTYFYTSGLQLEDGDIILRDNKKIDPTKWKGFSLQQNDKIIRNNKLLKNFKIQEKINIDLEPDDVIVRKNINNIDKYLKINDKYYDFINVEKYLTSYKKSLTGKYYPSFFYINNKILPIVVNGKILTQDERRTYIVKLTDILLLREIKEESYTEISIESLKLQNREYKYKVGDKLFRKGVELTNFEIKSCSQFKIQIGDIVERQLKSGDVGIIGRQPTLHVGSMISRKLRILNEDSNLNNNFQAKGIRFNLSLTKSLNADFDGDEMNLYVPQSYLAQSELINVSSTKGLIKSTQSSSLMQTLCQDALVGGYYYTYKKVKLTRDQFYDASMIIEDSYSKIQHILDVVRWINKDKNIQEEEIYYGNYLFSILLPNDFEYSKCDTIITRGVMIKGVLNKNNLGAGFNSIPHKLEKDYGADVCIDFLSNYQMLIANILGITGFSIGLDDCYIDQDNVDKIQESITKTYIQAQSIIETEKDLEARETKINYCLSNTVQVGVDISKSILKPDNALNIMVLSGAKGNYQNIAQITSMVGQQTVEGKRISEVYGGRTLPHYPFDGMTDKDIYESRGFIRNGYLLGVTPLEFYFQNIGGRTGLIDTAIKTAKSGYIQRKLTKKMEDLKINYLNYVVNANNDVIQPSFGIGLDPSRLISVGGKLSFTNPITILDMINSEVEFEEFNKN